MTLRTACRTRRYILQSGMNHGADLYTRLMVLDGVAMLCVQVFCVIATVQFIGLTRAIPQPLFFGVFFTGWLRTATSIIVATVAFARWWIYRKACRDEK
jgi:hypothetical protein